MNISQHKIKKFSKVPDYPSSQLSEDWDFTFLLELIEWKLKKMSKYFHTANIVENEGRKGDICDKAIKILHAGYFTNYVLSLDLDDIYVNTKNAKRFLNPKRYEFTFNHKKLYRLYFKADVRAEKAKVLFWKYLHHYIEQLWD